jgi:hypothetical protein
MTFVTSSDVLQRCGDAEALHIWANSWVMSIFLFWAEKQTNLSPVFNKWFMGKPQIVARNLLWNMMRDVNTDIMA